MNVLVLSKSRKDNIPIETSGTGETKHSRLQTAWPIPMVEPQTTKTTDLNHLHSADFLLSPLETILESIYDPGLDNISLHDLIEAYSTLSTRIRSQAKYLLQDQPLPAIEALRENSSSLTHALKRDLRRILPEIAAHTQESISTTTPMMTHDIQYTRDIAILCLHALCFLSDVSVFENLYSVFSKNELCELLGTLLHLALVDDLATPSRLKTWSLVVWILQVQKLPSITLEHEKSSVVSVLRRSIEGELGSQATLDGLKAVSRLLAHHLDLFIMPLTKLLPSILDCLISDSAECRMNAAISLSSFSTAKLSALTSPRTEYPQEKIMDAIHAFIHLQSLSSDSSQDEPSLSSIFKASLRTTPAWALTVLATIMVLLDYSLFLRSRSLKFCVNHLAHVASHEYSDVAAVHPHIWRILVWAFVRVPQEAHFEQDYMRYTKSRDDIQVGAYKVIAQVLRGGVGISLTSALLGLGNDVIDPAVASDNVLRALDIVGRMVSGKLRSDPEEGLLLLNRLVSAIGTANDSTAVLVEEWEKNHLPATRLLDGTVLHSTLKKLRRVVRDMEVVKIDRVRCLSETEIVANWDSLVVIWANSARNAVGKPSFQFWGEVMHIWQSLLLARADLAERDGHLTASSIFAKQVTSIITQFLPTDLSRAAVNHLILIKKLWNVTKNIFSSSWLHSPAEIILAAVLIRQFSFQDNSVRVAWSELCADLISVGIPSVLHVVSSRSDLGQGLEATRELWTILAKAWQTPVEDVPWGNIAAFLAIPYRWDSSVPNTSANVDIVRRVWELSDSESELWVGVLRSAVTLATVASVRSVEVVSVVLQQIGGEGKELLSTSPKTIISILSHVDISVGNALPAEVFSLVDLVLVSHYPISKLELQPMLVEVLLSLGRVIGTASPHMIIQLLSVIEKGLYLWIRDEREILSQTQHDTLVTNVYCRVLTALRHHEPTLNTLLTISPFLTSGFGRLHQPLIGPLAFETFWRATYHNIDELRSHYSESLRSCLLAFSDTWGGSMGDELSNYSESQKTRMSTVPDSQASRYDAQGSWGYPVYSTRSHPKLSTAIQASGTPPLKHLPETSPSERAIKRRKVDYPDHLTALNELQQYSSYQDGESNIQNADSSVRGRSVQSSYQIPSSTSHFPSIPNSEHIPLVLSMTSKTSNAYHQPDRRKHPTNVDENGPKRRKIETGCGVERFSPSINRTHSDGLRQVGHSTQDRLKGKSVQSEPIFPADHLDNGYSQTTMYRKRKMVLDWVGGPRNKESHLFWPDASLPNTPRKLQAYRAGGRDATSTDPSSPEDYNSWEAAVTVEEIRRLQHELGGSDHSFRGSEMDMEDQSESDITDVLTALRILDSDTLPSPLSNIPNRPQLRQPRYQTGPGSIPVRSPPRPGPLRRNQTTSTGLNIEGLIQTCAVVEDGASQAPVADLMHATALINKIGTKLTEHLTRRLVGQAPQPD